MSATMEIGFAPRSSVKAVVPRAVPVVERGSNARLGLLLLAVSGTVSVSGLYWVGSLVVSLFA